MKIITKFKIHQPTRYIHLDTERGGHGPDFSRDFRKPPHDLIGKGEKHERIIADAIKEIINRTMAEESLKRLATEITGQDFTISREAIIERIVAEVIAEGEHASLSTPDRAKLRETLGTDPTELVKREIQSVVEETGMLAEFVGLVFAARLSKAIQ